MCFLTLGVIHGEEGNRFNAERRAFIESILIDSVSFEDETIAQALSFAWARTVELDPAMPPKEKGFSVLLRYTTGEMYPRWGASSYAPPQNPGKNRINYHAKNIALLALLKEIARQTGYDLHATSVGVVFCPPGTSPFPNAHSSKGDIWETLAKAPRQPQEHKSGEQDGAPPP